MLNRNIFYQASLNQRALFKFKFCVLLYLVILFLLINPIIKIQTNNVSEHNILGGAPSIKPIGSYCRLKNTYKRGNTAFHGDCFQRCIKAHLEL